MSREVSRATLESQLQDLGVKEGSVLLVHTSFKATGPVEGGPEGLIAAIRGVLEEEGTVVMPSMSDDDDHPFDPGSTPCLGMGIVADTFWRMPGVLRSDSPHAFAAIGPRAGEITAPHPIDVPHGLDSPVGRVYRMDGHVLLLGVGHDANTTIHLAENIAGVRYRRAKHLTVLENGRPARVDYAEIDHCCQRFDLADGWLSERGLQAEGTVGHGTARLLRTRDIAKVVSARLRKDETVFLHGPGVDEECDEARASILPVSS